MVFERVQERDANEIKILKIEPQMSMIGKRFTRMGAAGNK